MEDQLARRAGGVHHPVADGSETDAAFTEILDQRDQMPHGSSQPVQPPDGQRVAGLQPFQALVSSGVAARSGYGCFMKRPTFEATF
jgi:hypothetical protein